MKKIILLLACLSIPVIFVFSQTTSWALTGNSGTNPSTNFIGTTDNQPLVLKTNGVENMRINSDGTITHKTTGASTTNTITFSTDNYYGGWVAINSISTDPSTGVGYRMNVNNAVNSQIFYNGGAYSYGTTIDGLAGNTDILSRTGDVYLSTGTFISNGLIVKNGTGNVGIGNSTPAVKLDVNGTTYSRKLYVGTPDANTVTYMGSNNLLAVNGTAVFVKAKVAVYGTAWPDYVFSPNYKLTPLDSLEQFIQLNKHLPEMPTAADVQKNGIDLGDNQTLLLKKIEELTLIVIEQNKRIDKLEEDLQLKQKVKK